MLYQHVKTVVYCFCIFMSMQKIGKNKSYFEFQFETFLIKKTWSLLKFLYIIFVNWNISGVGNKNIGKYCEVLSKENIYYEIASILSSGNSDVQNIYSIILCKLYLN